MKSNEVETTHKHPETINGNVKNLSKRMKMKDKGKSWNKEMEGVGTSLNSISKDN
jgi:hypothetical protein